jgi:hypothetical protein
MRRSVAARTAWASTAHLACMLLLLAPQHGAAQGGAGAAPRRPGGQDTGGSGEGGNVTGRANDPIADALWPAGRGTAPGDQVKRLGQEEEVEGERLDGSQSTAPGRVHGTMRR